MRLAAVALLVVLAGCTTPAPPTQVTVFAAASLTDSFEQLTAAFEAENPDVDIVLSFGGSSTLAAQIVEGAPADVFAAASDATMATVTDAGVGTTGPVTFATNSLVIAVPTGNPGGVVGLADFANPELLIAVCAAEVPCGAASAAALQGTSPSIDTFEQDVRAVLSKVELGEVDAGLVYVTDVLGNGRVESIAIDAVTTQYPIVTVTRLDAARAFVDFVMSKEGQATLKAAGFGAP